MKNLLVFACAVIFAVLFMGAGSGKTTKPTDNNSVQIRKQIADDYRAWGKENDYLTKGR